jgi:fumarate reductase flavoprotein subunit
VRGSRDPTVDAWETAEAPPRRPLGRRGGDLEGIRESLFQVMWDEVGILRDAAGLARASGRLAQLEGELEATGIDESDLRYNLSWHDWLNLASLLAVSRAICAAAAAREDSRGAHFREDHPQAGELATSAFSRVRRDAGDGYEVAWKPVEFTRVRPGQSLLKE